MRYPRLALSFVLVAAGLLATAMGGQEERPPRANEVVVVRVSSIIHPVAKDVLVEALRQGEERNAQAVVVELNTPGGLLDVTREMTTAMLGAQVPVVVYIAPSGSQGASAGFFLLMAADIAAMAPGTNTGAAHPVQLAPQDQEGAPSPVGEKVVEDASAMIRTLAARHGRNVELAEAAVVESRSFTETEAHEQGLVEIVSPSLLRLLEELDGRTVEKAEQTFTLATSGAEIHRVEMTFIQRLLSTVSHPNIAMLLLSLGFIGIYIELANPGTIVPGVVGVLSLLLGFYALSVLPLNYLGVALLLLAAFLFIAEVYVASYGLLTMGGVVSLVLGAMMLIRSPDPALRISPWLIAGLAAGVAVTVLMLMTLVVRTHRSQVATGAEGLVGRIAVAHTDLQPIGKVFIHGEVWNARSEAPAPAGVDVEIVGVEGLRLKVRPRAEAPVPAEGPEEREA